MTYDIEELSLKNKSEEEQKRTRTIFEYLKNKILKGEEVSEYEKDFFCIGVRLSQLNDGKIEDYECCENFKFKSLYLSYFQDLTGLGEYQKIRGTERYNPTQAEIKLDLKYLKAKALEWKKTIEKTNHSDELLQQISKETRNDLKEIEKTKRKLPFRKDREKSALYNLRTLLRSKFIFCMALQIFELFDNEEFVLRLNGEEIEINEFSIIHIISRHYSEITKSNPERSFHNKDFEAKYFNKQLGKIFKKIDESGFYIGKSIESILFKYKNVNYQVWVKERIKQIKGKGNVKFNRLETFYPVKEPKELSKINSEYELKKINDDLSVYIK